MSDSHEANQAELTGNEDDAKYLLHNRHQIIGVLKELQKKTANISAYYRNGTRNILTSIVEVLPDKDLVVIDSSSSQSQNEELLKEDSVFCVAKVDNIEIKFSLKGIRKARFNRDIVFAAPLPESVYRPQRREFFRVSTPAFNPITCTLNKEDLGQLELAVADISIGGLGLYDPDLDHYYAPGELLNDCILELEGFGRIETTLEVRNSFLTTRKDGTEVTRIGCSFTQLSMPENAIIQRYLHKLQLEQRDNY